MEKGRIDAMARSVLNIVSISLQSVAVWRLQPLRLDKIIAAYGEYLSITLNGKGKRTSSVQTMELWQEHTGKLPNCKLAS